MRLIDADALKKSVPNTHVDIFENCRNCELLDDEQVEELIDNAPTIDAVPVVRCKDCFLYGECQAAKFYGDDGYCSIGEMKDDDIR